MVAPVVPEVVVVVVETTTTASLGCVRVIVFTLI